MFTHTPEMKYCAQGRQAPTKCSRQGGLSQGAGGTAASHGDLLQTLLLPQMFANRNSNPDVALQVSGGDFPHVMVYGPPGAGKKTRVMGMLRETFGSGVEKVARLS